MSGFIVTRDVTVDECPWLEADIPAGTTMYRCAGPTYGCIGPFGVAMTFDPEGDYPFFEVPAMAVEAIQ